MSPQPLDLVAEIDSPGPAGSAGRVRTVVRGQSAIASSSGTLHSLALIPPRPAACDAAVAAISAADVVVLGPGSWFTSVIPHLLVPDLAAALVGTEARVVVVLNLAPQAGETDGFSAPEHLRTLLRQCPNLELDVVIADSAGTGDRHELSAYAASIGAELVIRPVAADGQSAQHDPQRLSAAFIEVFGQPLLGNRLGSDGEATRRSVAS